MTPAAEDRLNFFEPMLYLIALGWGLGGFIKEINGISYIEFIAPGIVMSSATPLFLFSGIFFPLKTCLKL
ncbi:MAG: hypothetical protein ACP5KH_00620 [Thermodesulfovibrio sp.]